MYCLLVHNIQRSTARSLILWMCFAELLEKSSSHPPTFGKNKSYPLLTPHTPPAWSWCSSPVSLKILQANKSGCNQLLQTLSPSKTASRCQPVQYRTGLNSDVHTHRGGIIKGEVWENAWVPFCAPSQSSATTRHDEREADEGGEVIPQDLIRNLVNSYWISFWTISLLNDLR